MILFSSNTKMFYKYLVHPDNVDEGGLNVKVESPTESMFYEMIVIRLCA